MLPLSTLRIAAVLLGLLVACPASTHAAPTLCRLTSLSPAAQSDSTTTTLARRRYGVIPRVWQRLASQPLLHLRIGRFEVAVQSPAQHCALVVSLLEQDSPGAPLAFGFGF